MYDFCGTIPLGALCVLGGVIGYIAKGSSVSLIAGGGSGISLLALGWTSLQRYKKKKERFIQAGASLLICAVLAVVMGKRALDSGKVMPGGLVSACSMGAVGFIPFPVALKSPGESIPCATPLDLKTELQARGSNTSHSRLPSLNHRHHVGCLLHNVSHGEKEEKR